MQLIKGSDLLALGKLMADLDTMIARIPPLEQICDRCGAKMGDHFIGGKSCPQPQKPSLWFWA